jgi:hypothetical protein
LKILAIDSGLAAPAVAIFDTAYDPGELRGDGDHLLRAWRCLHYVGSERTSAKIPDVDRLVQLNDWARTLTTLERFGKRPDVAIVEKPVQWGRSDKGRRKGQGHGATAADVARLNMAIGAIACGLESAGRVLLMKAFKSSKTERHQIVDHLGRMFPAALSGRRLNADQRDAIYIGLYWLARWFRFGDAVWVEHVVDGELQQEVPIAAMFR